VSLPPELLKCVDNFTRFYESRTSHRKLKWIHTLGTSTVMGRFDAKPIELVRPASTVQRGVSMLGIPVLEADRCARDDGTDMARSETL
jgi:hypothetical protein